MSQIACESLTKANIFFNEIAARLIDVDSAHHLADCPQWQAESIVEGDQTFAGRPGRDRIAAQPDRFAFALNASRQKPAQMHIDLGRLRQYHLWNRVGRIETQIAH